MENNNENSKVCSVCGTPLTDAPVCSQCGATVAATAQQAPAPAAEIVSDPEPAVPARPQPWKFPVAAVILTGIAVVWSVILLFISEIVTPFTVIYACCLAAVLAGMIIYKKQRNFIVGFACLVYACAQLIALANSVSLQRDAGLPVITVAAMSIVGAIVILCYAAFAISYLVAKPKIAILKNIMAGFLAAFGLVAVLVMGVAIMASGRMQSATALFSYLLNYTVLGVGVILYTPFKKR